MILEIDGLKLPPTIGEPPYKGNRDTRRQTVSGRLITKLDTSEKWIIPVLFDSFTLSLEFQAAFYLKCAAMRQTAATIKFISPYDNTEVTVTAQCINRAAPRVLNLYAGLPQLYQNIGAVFQEV